MAREVGCVEFTNIVRGLVEKTKQYFAQEKELAATLSVGERRQVLADLQAEFDLAKEKGLSAYHLACRSEIAEKYGFNFVSQLYPHSKGGYIAWGAHNYGVQGLGEFRLIRLKSVSEFELADDQSHFLAVSGFYNGVAAAADELKAFHLNFFLINEDGERISAVYDGDEYANPFLFHSDLTPLYNGEPYPLAIWDKVKGNAKDTGRYLKPDGEEFQANPKIDFSSDKYSEGLLWSEKDGVQVALDRKGEVAFSLEQDFYRLFPFHDGVALGFVSKYFTTRNGVCYQVFAISKAGEVEQIDSILVGDHGNHPDCEGFASEGYYSASFGGQHFYFNTEGGKIIPKEQFPNYSYSYFSHGFARVQSMDTAQRYLPTDFLINLEGERVTPYLEVVTGFRDGFCAARKDGKWFLYDENLNKIEIKTELPVSDARSIAEGLLQVKLEDGSFTYVDVTGKQMMSKIECEHISDMEKGVACVDPGTRLDNSDGYFIDKKGRKIFEGEWK
jgi:hypothetical protein